MAIETYPREIPIGSDGDTDTLELREGTLVMAFRRDPEGNPADAGRMDQFMRGFEMAPFEIEPMLAERLESRSMRWGRMLGDPASAQDIARRIQSEAADIVELASPVYVPASCRTDWMAVAPDTSTLLVDPGDAEAQIREALPDLGLVWDPDWPRELEPLMRLDLRRGLPDDGFELAERLRELGAKNVEFDWIKLDPQEGLPGTKHWPLQWNLADIGMSEAWDLAKAKGAGVTVAVIDEGFDVSHPDLPAARAPRGVRAAFTGPSQPTSQDVRVSPTPTPAGKDTTNDGRWHGTAVAGIIAARHGTASGIAGMAPDCSLMLLKVQTPMKSSNVAAAMAWAVTNGAKIINFSISAAGPSFAIKSAVDDAWNRGAVICASSGTGSPPDAANAPMLYPAGYRQVIAVGACDRDGEPKVLGKAEERWFSKYGTTLDMTGRLSVLAPGITVPSIDARNAAGYNAGRGKDAAKDERRISWFYRDYLGDEAGDEDGEYIFPFTGTSSAAPHVSGLAALLVAENPTWRNVDVRRAIEIGCDEVGGVAAYTVGGGVKRWSPIRGYGRINPVRSLRWKPGQPRPA
jgi:subtilisin family serine protease